MNTQPISAFIIAGGKSTRFGEDKTIFKFNGKPLIEHVIESIKPAIQDIAIIADDTNKFAYLGLTCYPDIIKGLGPFGGIYSALVNSKTERTFIAASDMPYLNTDLIKYISMISKGYDVTIPHIGGWYEPLHAVYAKTCLPPIKKCIENEKRQIISFFSEVSVQSVSGDKIKEFADPLLVFKNINYRNETYEGSNTPVR